MLSREPHTNMELVDIVSRSIPPIPWVEGDNIPWNEPGFSERMLQEHLRQDSDRASRRFAKIDEQVAWIHDTVLRGRPSRILDLACGPGLYLSRLARLGHTGHGVDFSPASIAYARETAASDRLDCTYDLADLRGAEFGTDFDLVMLLFGQLNVFRREEARDILERACRALRPGGLLLIEPQREETVVAGGKSAPSWYSSPGGLFSPRPHICLLENSWNESTRASTQRFFIIDAATGEVTRHALSNEAYSEGEFVALLRGSGFEDIQFYPSLRGTEDVSQSVNLVVLARRAGSSAEWPPS